jgi:elongation factor 1 alpha-like protein
MLKDKFTVPTRKIEEPFILAVQDYFKGGLGSGGSGNVSVSGRISAGSVQVGDRLLAMPINQFGIVKGIKF